MMIFRDRNFFLTLVFKRKRRKKTMLQIMGSYPRNVKKKKGKKKQTTLRFFVSYCATTERRIRKLSSVFQSRTGESYDRYGGFKNDGNLEMILLNNRII